MFWEKDIQKKEQINSLVERGREKERKWEIGRLEYERNLYINKNVHEKFSQN